MMINNGIVDRRAGEVRRLSELRGNIVIFHLREYGLVRSQPVLTRSNWGCPPGEKHWHGAAPGTVMSHIAIQEELNGKAVDWLERVTDEQCRGTPVDE